MNHATYRPCYLHPQNPAQYGCARCSRSICQECALLTEAGYLCPQCRTLAGQPLAGNEPFKPLERLAKPKTRYLNPFDLPLHRPIITSILLLIIGIVFALETMNGGSTNENTLIRFGAMYGPKMVQGEWWRLFTAMFVHIGLPHILFNGIALYSLGREAEMLFGSTRYLFIYLLSGLMGSLFSFGLKGINEFSAGASGAVFGAAGMLLAFYLFHQSRLGEFGKARRQSMMQMLLLNAVIGLSVSSINNWAHLGGFLGGLVLGYLFVPRYRPIANSRQVEDFGDFRHRPLFVIGSLAFTALFFLLTWWLHHS